MSRGDWIRNTRRERIVYVPVQGDLPSSVITLTGITTEGGLIPFSAFTIADGDATVSVSSADELYILSEADDYYSLTIRSYQGASSVSVPSGNKYLVISQGSTFWLSTADNERFVKLTLTGPITSSIPLSLLMSFSKLSFHINLNE